MRIVIQKTKVRARFNELGVQVPEETISMLNDHVNRLVTRMARRCVDGNVKRLSPNLFHIALGRYTDG